MEQAASTLPRARLCLAESDVAAARAAASCAQQIFADHSDQAGLAAVEDLGILDAGVVVESNRFATPDW